MAGGSHYCLKGVPKEARHRLINENLCMCLHQGLSKRGF